MRPAVHEAGDRPAGFGGTAIGKALRACKKVLADREEGDQMIVLVTDGISYDLAEAEARTSPRS